MKNNSITIRLILMNFLEFAVWGAYLTSLGRYLGNIGLGTQIKWFFVFYIYSLITSIPLLK